MRRKSEIRLGQLLVQKQWCSLRQVNEALARQSDLKGSSEYRPLGELLVERGFLTRARLKEALALLGALTLECEACKVEYAVARFDPDRQYHCPKCNVELHLGQPLRGGRRSDLPDVSDAATASPASGGAAASSPSGEDNGKGDKDSLVGRVLGGCQITERLARGGMGLVYKARQLNLNRTVAVKVLAEEFARDRVFVQRFMEEARSAAQLNHGNIVHINDVGEFQGVYYFTMEYIDGKNLRTILNERQTLPVRRSIEIVLQVCEALLHAHKRGIVHRDIKPENIMITHEGIVKLADLGLAKKVTHSQTGMTPEGSILGTPYYMAPEQAKDFSNVDHRSDIYSLGVTLYTMISGKVPFDANSAIEVMIKALAGKRPALRDVGKSVTPELEAVVDRMMARSPEERYQSVDKVIANLTRVLETLERDVETIEQV